MNNSIMAQSLRYANSGCQLGVPIAAAYQPTEEQKREIAERQAKEAKKDTASLVIALAEKFMTYSCLSVQDAMAKAEEFNETATRYYEANA